MSDIVETLRGMADSLPEGWIMVDAANEIEHLRSTVSILRRLAGPVAIDGSFRDIKPDAASRPLETDL